MKAYTVYIFSEEGPDKDINTNEKGPNEEIWLGTLLDSLDICFN